MLWDMILRAIEGATVEIKSIETTGNGIRLNIEIRRPNPNP